MSKDKKSPADKTDETADRPLIQYQAVPLEEPRFNSTKRTGSKDIPPAKADQTAIGINVDTLYALNKGKGRDRSPDGVAAADEISTDLIAKTLGKSGKKDAHLALPKDATDVAYVATPVDQVNNGLGTFFKSLFAILGWSLFLPVRLLMVLGRFLIAPRRSLSAFSYMVESRLSEKLAIIVGVSLLSLSGGLLLWLVDSLNWPHLTRLLSTVSMVPLAIAMGLHFAPKRPVLQIGLFVSGAIAALVCWVFVPTLAGHNLWSARTHFKRIEKQLEGLTPGLFSRFQEGRSDRSSLVWEFPQFLPKVRQQEEKWIRQSIDIEIQGIEKRKLTHENIQEKLRRLQENLQVLAQQPLEPKQLDPFRKELLLLRLAKARESADQLMKNKRYQEAYDQIIKPMINELEKEGKELGLEEELMQFRSSFETIARLANLASGQAP